MIDTARVAVDRRQLDAATAASDTAQCPSGFDTAAVTSRRSTRKARRRDRGDRSVRLLGRRWARRSRCRRDDVQRDGRDHESRRLADVRDVARSRPSTSATRPTSRFDVSFLTDGGKFQLAWQLVEDVGRHDAGRLRRDVGDDDVDGARRADEHDHDAAPSNSSAADAPRSGITGAVHRRHVHASRSGC